MKKILLIVWLIAYAIDSQAQYDTPQLEFVVELKVKCEGAYQVGKTQHGNRFVIPIVGGTFQGPRMKGIILPGGADYQLQDATTGRTELEAIYSIQTDDGVNIHIRNCGLIYNGSDEQGNPQSYFSTIPKFEAPQDSQYNWLNNAVFVCQPGKINGDETVCLRIWKVK